MLMGQSSGIKGGPLILSFSLMFARSVAVKAFQDQGTLQAYVQANVTIRVGSSVGSPRSSYRSNRKYSHKLQAPMGPELVYPKG